MKHEDRHEVETDLAEMTIEDARLVQDAGMGAIAQRAASLRDVADIAYELAAAQAVVDSSGVYAHLELMAEATGALFALAGTGTQTVRAEVGGVQIAHAPIGPGAASATRWRRGLAAALLTEKTDVRETLLAVDRATLESAEAKAGPHAYLYIEFLQRWLRGESDVAPPLVAALEATDPAVVDPARLDVVLDVEVPLMEVAYRLLDNDREGFDDAVAKALALHRKYWSSEDNASDPEGWIALEISALVALARSAAGFEVEVESNLLVDPMN